jgi:hypothetical protein
MSDPKFVEAWQPSVVDLGGDRFGEMLSRFVPMTRHDVYDILEEQAGTRRKFGQIALGWGLCEPRHVWQAWNLQIVGRTPRVDLDRFGIDAQAVTDLPAWVAVTLGVVPVRSMEGKLVVAASEKSLPRAIELLTPHARKPVTFVLADAEQIERAIRRYYAEPTRASEFPRGTHAATGRQICAGKRCGEKCKGDACPTRHKLELLAAVA